MAVYYKFKSAKDYDSILIEGQFISVGNLKERIFESKHLGRGTDFDLMISNAQTNEEYVDEAAMIPKNTSVLIRRVPGRPRKRIVTEPDEPKVVDDKAEELPPQSSMFVGNSSAAMNNPEDSEWDVFGNDLYAPEVVPTQSGHLGLDVSSASRIDEDDKLKALIETPALDWSRQGQDGFGGRGFGRGFGRGVMAGRGFGRGGFERKTPPGYICHRCKVPGHFIQHCPTNGDPNYDVRKVKPPTGIPKSMLMATPDGSYVLPSGAVAVLKPNEAAFEKEIEGMPSTRSVNDLPPELRCPLCKEVMKDAVLTSKCCFRSFCDKCIRDYIISKSICICGAPNILADDLLPNKTLRETISRILESTTSSTENVGSLVQVQDMESARHVPSPPKVPSTALSGALKPKQTSPILHSSDVKVANVKEADVVSEGKAVNTVEHSLEKKTVRKNDQPELAPKSMSTKEPISPESPPVPDEGQEKSLGAEQGKKKKKKKARVLGSGTDMQWRGFQELGPENYTGMPLGPSAYNPYWGGGMLMGFDGFMAPFGGAMPYNMGYAPGPFDVPFGGLLPPDPFAAQGYMIPPLPPRDLSELGFNNMNMNKAAPMSREEFEARKADIRKKREFERLNERERLRDGRGVGKEVSSSGPDISSMKGKPRLISRDERPGRASESVRQSSPVPPPRLPSKQRSSERDVERERKRDDEEAAAAAAAAEQERRHKASVFSRISFPSESEKEAKKKRTSSSSDTAAAATNGAIKDHLHPHHRSHREQDDRKRSSYEQHESSEEKEDEDYHFKRRPSRREREDDDDDGRHSRVSRERRR